MGFFGMLKICEIKTKPAGLSGWFCGISRLHILGDPAAQVSGGEPGGLIAKKQQSIFVPEQIQLGGEVLVGVPEPQQHRQIREQIQLEALQSGTFNLGIVICGGLILFDYVFIRIGLILNSKRFISELLYELTGK